MHHRSEQMEIEKTHNDNFPDWFRDGVSDHSKFIVWTKLIFDHYLT